MEWGTGFCFACSLFFFPILETILKSSAGLYRAASLSLPDPLWIRRNFLFPKSELLFADMHILIGTAKGFSTVTSVYKRSPVSLFLQHFIFSWNSLFPVVNTLALPSLWWQPFFERVGKGNDEQLDAYHVPGALYQHVMCRTLIDPARLRWW